MHHEIKWGTIFDSIMQSFDQYEELNTENIEEILDYLVSYKWTKEEFLSMHTTQKNKNKVKLPKNLIDTLNDAFNYERYKNKGSNGSDGSDDEMDDDDEENNDDEE